MTHNNLELIFLFLNRYIFICKKYNTKIYLAKKLVTEMDEMKQNVKFSCLGLTYYKYILFHGV